MSCFTRIANSMRGNSPETMAAVKKTVQALIDENAAVLFGKSWCGFCTAAKRTLNSYNADFKILDLDLMDDGAAIQDALYELTGQRTVPSIFIGQKHIGGNSELQSLGGRLPPLLKQAGAVKA